MRKKLEDVNSREQDRDRDDKSTLGNSPQRKASIPYYKDNGKRQPSSDLINYLFQRLVCLIVSNI